LTSSNTKTALLSTKKEEKEYSEVFSYSSTQNRIIY